MLVPAGRARPHGCARGRAVNALISDGIDVDLFAGGGGASTGIEAATGRPIDVALNHDEIALEVHKANHPLTQHFPKNVWKAKPLEVTGGRPVRLLWTSPDCFPAGTLVMTPSGLRPIEFIHEGQLVLTHRNRWRTVMGVMAHEADTVSVRGYGHYGLVTTPNHRFYSKRITKRYPTDKATGKRTGVERTLVENPYWPTAESMPEKLWATPRVFPEAAIPTCAGAEFSESFFYLLGRWVGDGSLNKGDVEICCGLDEVAPMEARIVREPLRRASGEPVPYRLVDHGSTKLVVWGDAPLVTWLRANFGDSCEGKTLPLWCLSMQANWRRALLAGYVDSDGYRGPATQTSSVSKALAVSVRLLAVSLGHAAALYRAPGRAGSIEGRSFQGRDIYSVRWREELQHETVMRDGSHLFTPVRDVAPAGRQVVHSLQVDEDESFVADGIVVHNCTHHSVAKGGKPLKKNIRALAWVVVKWARDVQPAVIFLENVQEFRGWGPLDRTGRPIKARKGETFRRWMRQLERLGYEVDYRVLDASLYGAPTRRRRLFLVARRDGQAIRWPEPTHGPGRLPLRTAAECIDWALPCPSIFERKRPLAEKTMWRIAQGIRRFVLESPRPFIVRTDHHQSHATNAFSADEPLGTVTTAQGHAVVVPSVVQMSHGEGAGKTKRRGRPAHPITEPLPTQSASNDFAILMPTIVGVGGRAGDSEATPGDAPVGTITAKNDRALVTPTLIKVNHGKLEARGEAVNEPLSTVTAAQRGHALVTPVLATIDQQGRGHDATTAADEPLPTTVTKNRHVVVAPTLVQTGYGERPGQKPRALDLQKPLGTCVDGQKHALVAAFLARHFGGMVGSDLPEPLHTVTSKDHHSLVTAELEVAHDGDGSGVEDGGGPSDRGATRRDGVETAQPQRDASAGTAAARGPQQAWVPGGEGERGRAPVHAGGASAGVDGAAGAHPDGPRHQPQERAAEGQSPGQYGDGDAQRESPARVPGSRSEAVEDGPEADPRRGRAQGPRAAGGRPELLRDSTTARRVADDGVPGFPPGVDHTLQVRAFLTAFYGSDATSGQQVLEPMRTITTKHRLGLVTIEGTEYQIVDIGLRMLEPHELLRAQFGDHAEHYDLSAARTKSKKVQLVGNSVCPDVAEALVRANLGSVAERRTA